MRTCGLIPGTNQRIILVGFSILCFAMAAPAQSGRRTKTEPTIPIAAVQPKADQPADPKPKVKAPPEASIIVGGDNSLSMNVPSGYIGIATDACVVRLKGAGTLDVSGPSNMSRSEAVQEAKKQTEAYILWLELKLDSMATYSRPELSVGYVLFAPKTGKAKSFGEIHLDTSNIGTGNVGVGLPTGNSAIYLERAMKDAGKEVGDRVISGLHGQADDMHKTLPHP
jgi:hypothetical protein